MSLISICVVNSINSYSSNSYNDSILSSINSYMTSTCVVNSIICSIDIIVGTGQPTLSFGISAASPALLLLYSYYYCILLLYVISIVIGINYYYIVII